MVESHIHRFVELLPGIKTILSPGIDTGHFGELNVMEDIAAFVSNPFLCNDIQVAKFQQVFTVCIRNSICADENNHFLTDTSQTSDWLSVSKCLNTQHSQTVFRHSHHTDLSE